MCEAFLGVLLQTVLIGPFAADSAYRSFLELQPQGCFSPMIQSQLDFCLPKEGIFDNPVLLSCNVRTRKNTPAVSFQWWHPACPQPWDGQAMSNPFHDCLSFTTVRGHAVWKTNMLMAHTRAGSPSKEQGGRGDQKPKKEQEIQGWRYIKSPGSWFRMGKEPFQGGKLD